MLYGIEISKHFKELHHVNFHVSQTIQKQQIILTIWLKRRVVDYEFMGSICFEKQNMQQKRTHTYANKHTHTHTHTCAYLSLCLQLAILFQQMSNFPLQFRSVLTDNLWRPGQKSSQIHAMNSLGANFLEKKQGTLLPREIKWASKQ